MRILHITDFHYFGGSKKYEQIALTDALAQSLKGQHLDFIVFSGDLVNSGVATHFCEAKEMLLDKIAGAVSLDRKNIFICEGNHDIDRSSIQQQTSSFLLKNINSAKDLDRFYTNCADFNGALLSGSNYYNFIKKDFVSHWDESDKVNELYTIHKRVINGKSVCFVSINTGWACQGDTDYGSLFYPIKALESAISETLSTKFDTRVLVMHHPFSWLKPFNAEEVEDLCYKNFDVILSGHVHANDIATHYRSKGIFHHVSPASLTYSKDATLGYCILDLNDYDLVSVKIERSSFNRTKGRFEAPEIINATIPVGEEKFRDIEFIKTVIKKRGVEIENANELLLDFNGKKGFLEVFNEPILRTRPDIKLRSLGGIDNISFDKILKLNDQSSENYIIYSKDKYGKTSLLKKVQIQWLNSFGKNNVIPLYLDAKDYVNRTEGVDLIRLFSHYYEINLRASEIRLELSKCYLLIDNYEPRTVFSASVAEFLSKHPNISYIFTTTQTVYKTIDDISIDDTSHQKLFIHDLTRKEMRTYTAKASTNQEPVQEMFLDRIAMMCKELQMPANYWTLSMVLFIHQDSEDNYRKNIFDILDLVIDKVLNKSALAFSNSRYSFKQYKQLCSVIAYDLLINHAATGYRNTFAGLLQVIENYNGQNLRVTATSRSLLDYLVNCNMLVKDDNELYTFRLNGFFEYFLAYYMQENDSFKIEVASDDNLFMSFKNEFEIYSSLVRNDTKLLDLLYSKTKSFIQSVKQVDTNESVIHAEGDVDTALDSGEIIVVTPKTYDQLLMAKVVEVQNLSARVKQTIQRTPFTHEAADAIFDAVTPLGMDASVKVKPIFNVGDKTPEIFERYISILARVYRNSDEVKDTKKVNEIFDFLLDAYSDFTFYLIDAVEKERRTAIEKAISEPEEDAFIYRILSNFTPTLVQMSFNDSLGHYNLEKIILKKIEELRKDAALNKLTSSKDANTHQYQLFILYFTLLDQDLTTARAKYYLDQIIDLVQMGILRTSISLKLGYYMMFKSYKDPELEDVLKQYTLQVQHKMLGTKVDLSGMHKEFANTAKSRLISGIAAGNKQPNKNKKKRKKKGK